MTISFNTKKVVFSILTCIFCGVIFIINYFFTLRGVNNLEKTYIIWGVIGWGVLFWCIFSWYKIRDEVICLYIAQIVVFFLFNFGQSLVVVFDAVDQQGALTNIFSYNTLVNAQIYTLLSVLAFHFGALLICKKKPNLVLKNNNPRNCNQVSGDILLSAIRFTGIILLIVSMPAFFYNTLKTIETVAQGGYGALYNYGVGGVRGEVVSSALGSRIIDFVSSYFVPALICLVIGDSKKKTQRNIYLGLMFIYMVEQFYIGGRSDAVKLLITIICVFHYLIKKLDKKAVFKLIIFGYFFISLLSVIGNVRGLPNRSISLYLTEFIASFGKENLFLTTISELGGSMFPLCSLFSIMPALGFKYGSTYLYALTTIIPNLGFWSIHPARLYANGSSWLMSVLNMTYGPGFSVTAEAYQNFGEIGFLFLVIIGIIFGKIYTMIDTDTAKIQPDKVAMTLIFFNATLTFVRNDFLSLIRSFFYIAIPVFLLIRIVYERKLKKLLK